MDSISMWIARDRSPLNPNRLPAIRVLIAIAIGTACLAAAGTADRPGYAASASATAPIEISPALPEIVDVRPGSILTLSFRVANPTASRQDLRESLVLPPGWVPIVPAESFACEPLASLARIFAVRIPQSALPGLYDVLYRVEGPANGSVQGTAQTAIRVQSAASLAFTIEDAPQPLVGGDECHARLRLRNQGNVGLRVSLRVDGEPGLRADCRPAFVTLAAGEDVVVDVAFRISSAVPGPGNYAPRVKAEATSPDGRTVSTGVSIPFEAIPNWTSRPERFKHVPAVLVLNTGGTGGRLGFQTEVRGSSGNPGGTLFDFQARTPGGSALGPFASREAYALSIRDQTVDALVGDQTFGFSRLTEQSMYGRGASVLVRAEHGLEIGGCGARSRTINPSPWEDWFYGAKKFEDRGRVGFGIMHRKDVDAPGRRDRLLNLTGALHLKDRADIDFEGATSKTTGGEGAPLPRGGDNSAYFLTANGPLPRGARWALTRLRAGADFRGDLHDNTRTDLRVNGSIWEGVQASACYDAREMNAKQRDPLSSASREHLFVCTVSDGRSPRFRLGLEGSLFQDDDLKDAIGRPLLERAVGVTVEHSGSRLTVRTELRGGSLQDPGPTGGNYHPLVYGLHGSYRPTPDSYVTMHYNDTAHDGGAWLGGRLLRHQREVELATGVDLNGRITFDVRCRNRMERLAPDAVSISGRWILRSGAMLTLQTSSLDQPGLHIRQVPFLLSFTVPFGLPVGRKPMDDVVTGRVADLATPGRPGIAGAILKVDGVAGATNRDGRFAIRCPQASSHVISIEPGTIGFGRVTATPMPLKVERRGRTPQLEIGVIHACTVNGKVVLVSENGTKRGIPDAPVEASDGNQTLHSTSDPDGAFSFADMRPGLWTIRVAARDLSVRVAPEEVTAQVLIGPGEERELEISFRPKPRIMRMIDTGTVKVGTGPVLTPAVAPAPVATPKHVAHPRRRGRR